MEEEITERDEEIGKDIIKQIQRLIFQAIWIYNGATHTHTHTQSCWLWYSMHSALARYYYAETIELKD